MPICVSALQNAKGLWCKSLEWIYYVIFYWQNREEEVVVKIYPYSISGGYDSGDLPAGRNWHMAFCATCERNIMGKIMQLDWGLWQSQKYMCICVLQAKNVYCDIPNASKEKHRSNSLHLFSGSPCTSLQSPSMLNTREE